MKKFIYTLPLLFIAVCSHAQNINDALRYSITDMNGTSRFKSLSGAMGALGGDFSALTVNPAGSSIFANNQIGGTLCVNDVTNNSDYFGTKNTAGRTQFDLNQIGGVLVFNNQDTKSQWKKFAFSINYENQQNFRNNVYASGTNPYLTNSSIVDYFLYYANGIPLSTVNGNDYSFGNMYYDEQQAYFGYQTYAINPVTADPTQTSYNGNVYAGAFSHNYKRISTGYNGKVVFNFSTEYANKLYLGMNINVHFSDFRQTTYFYESNNNNLTDGLQNIHFNNELYTLGKGYSMNFGAIYKPIKNVRLGLAYETPTWYKFRDSFSQWASSYHIESGVGTSTTVDPNAVMNYQPYRLNSAGKINASFAYIFGKYGFISIDYTNKNYQNLKFKVPHSNSNLISDYDYSPQNNYMKNVLTNASEVRIGAEGKVKKLSIRGGFRYEQSPYKSFNGEKEIGDLKGFSTGLGYNFGATKIDVAYSHSQRNYNQRFFDVGMTDPALIKQKVNNFTLTVLFEL